MLCISHTLSCVKEPLFTTACIHPEVCLRHMLSEMTQNHAGPFQALHETFSVN